ELFLLPFFWQGFLTAFSFLLPGFGVMNAIPLSFPSFFLYLFGMLLAVPLLSFVLFKRWKNQRERTLSFFLGLSIGSLPAIWPYSPFIHFIHQETIVNMTNIQMVISFFCFLLGYFPVLKLMKLQKMK
ncbi:MAG TPA: hypothetical protein VLG44_02790, partial [Chlamydiales bacterium]|nr:hypothetical protein [Chlamydiales bacterium]